MVKVSIIVPAYNESSRIRKCINSLINQQFKDIEIVVINDGSIDNTLDILNGYNDNRIKVFSQKNQGQGAARNLGIEKSCGQYIMFVDADDFVDENIVNTLLTKLESDNLDIAICDLYKCYGTKKELFKNFQHFTDNNILNFMMSHPGPVGRLYKKDLFTKNNIKFIEGYVNEDLGTIPLLGIYAKRISYVEKPLYYYVIHQDSTTQQLSYSKKLEDIFFVLNNLKKDFIKRADTKFNDVIEFLYIEHLLYSASLKFISFGEQGKKQILKIISIMQKEYPNWGKNPYLKCKSKKFNLVCNLTYNKHFKILKLLKSLKK